MFKSYSPWRKGTLPCTYDSIQILLRNSCWKKNKQSPFLDSHCNVRCLCTWQHHEQSLFITCLATVVIVISTCCHFRTANIVSTFMHSKQGPGSTVMLHFNKQQWFVLLTLIFGTTEVFHWATVLYLSPLPSKIKNSQKRTIGPFWQPSNHVENF